MARGKVKNALSVSKLHIQTLESFLQESVVILRALEEQKTAAGEVFIHEKRLIEARREYSHLQDELSVAHAKHARLRRNKLALQSA
ncbi:hypothetical protein JK231_23670 [Pantoea sp. JGM49]|uniref:hypothetical protein n=1 Tax=Pantoea sp. JGM49 TaxID=2799791 RepID=UPI001BA4C9BA|nr:hypothetical protein [Pantoea sp. JGM49]MBS0883593.1 hypothetical protein [Pantoea sp. JGM49]